MVRLVACVALLAACSAGGSSSGSSDDGAGGSAAGGSGPGGQGGIDITTSSSSTGGLGGASCTPGNGGQIGVDCASVGIVLEPPYDADYSCLDLGTDGDVPPKWGGLTVALDDPNVLYLGGNANYAEGMLYSIGIVRDAQCHVIGFSGAPATLYAEAAYNDGGVRYGPGDVLFLARWPVNELGFLKPGSTVTDKIIDTEALGVAYSLAALDFVPEGFGGAGQLKLVAWPGGEWYTASYTPDANGTFDLGAVTYETTIVGGPEGVVYIEAGNPQFSVNGMLVAEWSANRIAAYDVDAEGDPIPATRRDFITGLMGAEGAFLDPLSGDFLFSTFADVNRVIVVRGFMPPPPLPE
jgi:hypothetical protein